MTEEQLAIRAGRGDNQAFDELAREMRGLVRSVARRYYAPGLDRDDLFQSGLIGLWRGCRTYKPERRNIPGVEGWSFTAYAVLCIERHVQTSVKTALRLKHAVVNTAVSLDAPAGGADGSPESLHEAIPSRGLDAFDVLVQKEELRVLTAAIEDLSPLERESLLGVAFLDETYEEITERIGGQGDVDNAVQRARRKLRYILTGDLERLPLGVAA